MGESLNLLGWPASMQRVVRYFVIRPRARAHMRELQRVLAVSSASVQRDLSALIAMGALTRRPDGRLVRYAVDERSPLWGALRTIVGALSDPVAVVRDALADVEGIDFACVFGSFATGTARQHSDVDVLIIGDAVDARTMHHQLAETALVLGREVNPVLYTRHALGERLASGARFPRNVLEGAMVRVAGDIETAAPIAAAAGIRMRERVA